MQLVDVVRRFSETPLKHRMSKYLLDYMLDDKGLLNRVKMVTTRAFLPDTMMVAQAGAEGPSFELELGVVEREEVSLVNGRLVKQTRKNRTVWVHDPVQAVEVLRKFDGILHVEFKFVDVVPDWYQEAVETAYVERQIQSDFAELVREQIDLLILGVLLKKEIDQALQQGDQEKFQEKVKLFKQVCDSCLWEF